MDRFEQIRSLSSTPEGAQMAMSLLQTHVIVGDELLPVAEEAELAEPIEEGDK